MASIKLKHSGGNGVIIAAPTSNPASDKTLTLPSDVDGTVVSKDSSNSLQNITGINGGQLGNRRLTINGDMRIAQRGTSFTASGSFPVDRFEVGHSGTDEAPTIAQADVASGTTPYTLGFRKCYKITNGNQTGGAGSSDEIHISHKIEAQDLANSGWNYTSSSSFITLSFWVKSSVAQEFHGFLYAPNGSAQLYSFSLGSLSADTWTKVTKTIPGNSNLTFNNDNGEGMNIRIACYKGSSTGSITQNQWAAFNTNLRYPTYTSTWYTTNDATFEVTGFQLEVGDTATDFEHRSFGQELALCQRYFFQATEIGSTSEVTNRPICIGTMFSSSDMRGIIDFPVEMRATPTLSSNDTSNSFYLQRSGSADMFDRLDGYYLTKKRASVRNSAHVSGTAGQAGIVAQETGDSNVNFSAEL